MQSIKNGQWPLHCNSYSPVMMPLSTIGKEVKSFSHLMSSQVTDESKFEFTYVRIPDPSFASTLGLKTGSTELKFASLSWKKHIFEDE